MYQDDRQKIEIFVSCRSLKDLDTFSKSDPQVILYLKGKNGWGEVARTECIQNNLNPNFSKTFVIDYIFEVQQHIKFTVLDIDGPNSFDFIGDTETTVGKVFGSKNQTCILDIFDKKKKKSGKFNFFS